MSRIPQLVAPDPPTWLSKGARVEWRRCAPVAYNLGTLKFRHYRSFAILCEALALEAAARKSIEADGLTIEAGSGGRKSNPALKVAEGARREATRLLADFGMNPAHPVLVEEAPDGGLEGLEGCDDALVDWPDEEDDQVEE